MRRVNVGPVTPSAVSTSGRHFDTAATRAAYPKAPTWVDNRDWNQIIVMNPSLLGCVFFESRI